MSESQETASGPPAVHISESLSAQLYREINAHTFELTLPAFAAVLEEVAAKYLPASASASETEHFIKHLRLEELALARACALGSDRAWDIFMARFREKLYTAAYAMIPAGANARELADSLYADLYGTRSADGCRISKLNSYTGRGSLEGWLRAVLAQEYINRFRKEQKLVSLEEQTEAGQQFEAASADPTAAVDRRLREATDEALDSLAGEEKFILANYYLDDRTLAQTARLPGVHESTISRKVEKITTAVRKAILTGLINRGMSKKEAEQTMEVEVAELSIDVRQRLVQEEGEQTVP